MNEFPKYQYKVIIREGHLDTFGHVNNATYLQLAEEARWEMLNVEGYGLGTVLESKKGPTILSLKIDFKRELKLRSTITIESCITDYKGKVGTLQQDFLMEDGKLAAALTLTIGLFDTTIRKLVLPTPEWRKALHLPS